MRYNGQRNLTISTSDVEVIQFVPSICSHVLKGCIASPKIADKVPLMVGAAAAAAALPLQMYDCPCCVPSLRVPLNPPPQGSDRGRLYSASLTFKLSGVTDSFHVYLGCERRGEKNNTIVFHKDECNELVKKCIRREVGQ